MSRRRYFGSVRRMASGRWQARYRDAAGNRFNAPYTFATKGDALRWLSAVETDIGRGEWHDPRLGRIPFSDWATHWLRMKAPSLRPSTQEAYRCLLQRHIVPRFGTTDIGSITPLDVQTWIIEMQASGLSFNSVAKAYRVLKGVFSGAVEAGIIARSPCVAKGVSTDRPTEMRSATAEEVAAIASAVDGRWEALVLAAAYSGLRWGELVGLRRGDVDLENNTIKVTRQLTEVNGKLAFGPPKTAAGRRTVGIPSFVATAMAAHLETYVAPEDEALVFTAEGGVPVRRSNFRRRVWEPATATAGVAGLRFHDLRHTAASLAAASGTSLRALMARIGHASVAAALRYQHVIDGQDAEIVRYLERFGDPSSRLDRN